MPPPPTSEVSYEPGAEETDTGPQEPRPTGDLESPLATASGPLTEDSLPQQVLDYRGDASAARQIGAPNGTWVAETEGPVASFEALPACGDMQEAVDAPAANHALAGAYIDPDGNLGMAVTMQFPDADAAGTWFGLFTERLQQCGPDGATPVSDLMATENEATYRRNLDVMYTEVAITEVDRVLLIGLGEKVDHAPMMAAAHDAIGR
ncbi:hypothetical protein [Propioniferax innocua]|nr:hypothetical protein [Propioniferax innocua]